MSRRKSTPKKVTDDISSFIDEYEETKTNTAYGEGSKVTEVAAATTNKHDVNVQDGAIKNLTKDGAGSNGVEHRRQVEQFVKDGNYNENGKSFTETGNPKELTERFGSDTGCYDRDQFSQNDFLMRRGEAMDRMGILDRGHFPMSMDLDPAAFMGFAKYKMYGKELERVASVSALEKSLSMKIDETQGQNGGNSMSNVHTCPYCDKVFPYKCHLQTHIRTHTGEKPFSCDHCGKNYANRSKLKRHMRSHTGERPYRCMHCNKCFSRSDNLTTHIVRTHQGLRIYSCEMCTMSFTTLSHLQRHEKTHSGFRPFACVLCDRKFSRQDNLETHVARVHSGNGGDMTPGGMELDEEKEGLLPSKMERGELTPEEIKDEPVDYTKDKQTTSSKRKRACPRKIEDNQEIIDVDEQSDSSEWDVGDNTDDLGPPTPQDDTMTKPDSKDSAQHTAIREFSQPPGQDSNDLSPPEGVNSYPESQMDADVGVRRPMYRSLIPDAMKKAAFDRHSFRPNLLGPQIGQVPPSSTSSMVTNLGRRKRGRPPMEEYSLESGPTSRLNPRQIGDTVRYEILDEDGLNSSRVEVEAMEMRAAVDVHICKYCGQPFGSSHLLMEHLKTHSENVHKCPLCFEELCTQGELQQHLKLHTGLPFLPSNIYQMISQNIEAMKREQKPTDKNPLLFNCKVCDATFKTVDSLARHAAEHNAENKFPCHICNLTFAKEEESRSHYIVHHGGTDLACRHCTAVFQTKADLQDHIQKKHRLHVCDFCGKKFGMLNKLQRHLRRHTGERPYKCDHCMKCFSRSDNLQTHVMRMHGIVSEPVRCDMCDKKFNSTESLAEHYRIHTGEKPFPCKICDKSFMWISGLKKHMQTHTGDVPFGCKCCSERFENNDDLSHHMLMHHVRSGDATTKYSYQGNSPDGTGDQDDDSSDDSLDSEPLYEHGRPLLVKPRDIDEPMDLSFDGQAQSNLEKVGGDSCPTKSGPLGHDHICNFCTIHCDSLPQLVLHYDLQHKDKRSEDLWGSILFAAKKLNGAGYHGNRLHGNSARRAIDFNPKSHLGARESLKLVFGRDFDKWAVLPKMNNILASHKPEVEKLRNDKADFTADLEGIETKINGGKVSMSPSEIDAKESPESSKSSDPADLHCSLCNLDFNTNDKLHEHMEAHIMRTSFKTDCQYTCRHCLRPFNDFSKFKGHLKWHSRWKQTCDICGCKFDSRSKMERHMRVHTGERPYECLHCQKRFTRTENLKMHVMRLHDVAEPLICKFCGLMFKEREDYINHCANEHMEDDGVLDSSDGEDKSMPTMVKQESLEMKNDVKTEVTSKMDATKEVKCEFCPSTFPGIAGLTDHVVTHTEIPPETLAAAFQTVIRKVTDSDKNKGPQTTNQHTEPDRQTNGQSTALKTEIKETTMTDAKTCDDGAHCAEPSAPSSSCQPAIHAKQENSISMIPNRNVPMINGKRGFEPWLNMKLTGGEGGACSPSTSRDDDPEDSSEGTDALSINENTEDPGKGLLKPGANPRPYPCEYCDKSFSTKSHLIIHVRTHTGEKPYRCMYCDMCFRTSSKLGRHLKTHTGETPHKCQYCDRQFGRKDNLKAHLNRAHAAPEGHQEVKCDKCEKVFVSEYALKQHMRMHSEKKHNCDFCDQAFTWRCHLVKHLKSQHPEVMAAEFQTEVQQASAVGPY